jgi:hypothetical protein
MCTYGHLFELSPPLCQCRLGLSEFAFVASGLLQVVARELVQLDQLSAALFQPGGDARVQLRPSRLRECLVGRIANQQVAEPEGVLARKLRLLGSDESLAHERGESGSHLALFRAERLDGAGTKPGAREDNPGDT